MYLRRIIQKTKKGLTLIEVIISIFLLSLIIIPLFSMSITAAKISKNSNNKIIAANLSQQVVERIKANYNKNNLNPVGLEYVSLVKEDGTDIKLKLSVTEGYELYKSSSYKNIYVKVKYGTSINIPNIFDGFGYYDITMAISSDKKIEIRDKTNKKIGGDIVLDSSNPELDIEKDEANSKYIINSSDISITPELKKVRVIFTESPSEETNVALLCNNIIGNLSVDIVNIKDSKYKYNLVTSGLIKSTYSIFDSSSTKISSSTYPIEVEVIYYDSIRNEINVLQKISTSGIL